MTRNQRHVGDTVRHGRVLTGVDVTGKKNGALIFVGQSLVKARKCRPHGEVPAVESVG